MGDIKKLAEKASNYWLEQGFFIQQMSTRTITSNGVKYNIADFEEEYLDSDSLEHIYETSEVIEVLKLDPKEKRKLTESTARNIYRNTINKTKKDIETSTESFGNTMNRNNFLPARWVEGKEKVLINRETKRISKFTYEAWADGLSPDELAFHMAGCLDIQLGYDPYNIKPLMEVKFEGHTITQYNTYIPPEWREKPVPESMDCPEIIERYLNHLFPNEEVLEFVLNWMHTALVSRNQTYLVLNGIKGTGKGIFVNLCRMLVGKDNYNQAPVSLLGSSDFNAAIKDNRILSFDEVKIGKKEHTKLKKYANEDQNIEMKGIDASKTIKTYNSFIISNNDRDDMYLEIDDRRFSVPELTETPMLNEYSQEEIDELVDLIDKDDEQIAYEFGYFIYLNGKSEKYTMNSAWKGERFKTLVYNSLREWQKYILDAIEDMDGQYLDIAKMRKNFNRANKDNSVSMPVHTHRIDDFIRGFKVPGEPMLAHVYKGEGRNSYLVKGEPREDYSDLLDDENRSASDEDLDAI